MQDGVVIPIIEKTVFDMSYLTGSGDTYETVIQNAIDVTPYSSVFIMVRVHSLDADAGSSMQVALYEVDPSREDGQDFEIDTAIVSQSVSSTDSAGDLFKSSAAASAPGPFLRVKVKGTGASGGGKVVYELSADMVCRAGV